MAEKILLLRHFKIKLKGPVVVKRTTEPRAGTYVVPPPKLLTLSVGPKYKRFILANSHVCLCTNTRISAAIVGLCKINHFYHAQFGQNTNKSGFLNGPKWKVLT